MAKIRSKLGLALLALAIFLFGQGLIIHTHSERIDSLLHESYKASASEIITANRMLEEISGLQSMLAGNDKAFSEESRTRFQNLDQLLTEASHDNSAALTAEVKNLSQLIATLKADWNQEPPLNDHLSTQCSQIMASLTHFAARSRLNMEQQASSASKIIATGRNYQLGGTLIAVALTSFALFLISKIISRPLDQMTRTAVAIAEGDKHLRFTIDRKDEFGQLATCFNEVLDSLQRAANQQTKLETRIADQARELERFFHLSADLLCIVNLDGSFVRTNHAFQIILGYSQKELANRSLFSILHPEDKDKTISQFNELSCRSRTNFTFQNRCLHSDGSWRYLSWNAIFMLDHGQIHAVARDQTEEWLQKEEDARRSRQLELYQNSSLRLRDAGMSSKPDFHRLLTEELVTTLGVSRASVWTLETKDDALSCAMMYEDGKHTSGQWLPMKDCPEYYAAIHQLEPIIANDAHNHPATRDLKESYLDPHGISSMLDIPIRAGEAVGGVICCEQKGNARVWTREEIKYVIDTASMAMLALEQHHRLIAQQELRMLNATLEEQIHKRSADFIENEQRFRLMINQVQDYAILMLDPGGHIISWNEGAKRTKGYSAEEILGRHYSCFYPPELLICKLPEQLLETAMKEGRSIHEGWRLRKDGSRFWAEVIITAIHDADHKLHGFTKVTRDLTEKKAADSALREALKTQQDLTQKAQAGERAKSEFLAIMSHEVRTPMNAILGFSEMLAQAPELSGQNLDFAKTIYNSGSSLLRILDDILDFSSSEAGTLKIQNSAFSPHDILDEVANLLGNVAENKGLTLTFHVSPRIPSLLIGDAGRLRQILLNLVGNGLKFAETGDVTLSVSPDLEKIGSHWKFAIRDTGPGIPPEYQARIFDPFVQTDTSASRRHGGAGLGLSICKRLSDLMGGTITLISGPEGGAEFIVSLPFEISPPATPTSTNGNGTQIDSAFADEYPLNILVVEDDPINMQLNLIVLGKLGYQPLSAVNGRLAVETWHRMRPNFILMDVQMPEMDGIEATQIIREIEKDESNLTPVFIAALTANTLEADRYRLLDAGISAYLNKPAQTSSLCQILSQASRQLTAS